MGICGTNKIKKDNISTDNEQSHSHLSTHEDISPPFKDMPEWEGDKYKGEGVKRMKGYKCSIPINELVKLREDFWSYKTKLDPIWKSLKQACTMDDIRAFNIISSLGLKPIYGNIGLLKDNKGKTYKIPNFCINDPYFEKIIILDEDESTENIRQNKPLKIYIYDLYNNTKKKIEALDNLTGKELKELHCNKENVNNCEQYNIRLFFGGAEIKDEHKLYQHNIKNDFTVQIMMTPKETL